MSGDEMILRRNECDEMIGDEMIGDEMIGNRFTVGPSYLVDNIRSTQK